MKDDQRVFTYGLLLFSLISIFLLRGFIFSTGLAQRGDLIWPFTSELYPRYTWHDYSQERRVISQFIVFSWLFFFPPHISERLFFVLVFTIGGASAFFAAFRLIKDTINGNDLTYPFLIGFIAGLVYVVNPITVIRITQLFLLWGYAFLPMLFHFTYKATFDNSNDSKRAILRKALPVAFIWFLMSCAPHWAIISLAVILVTALIGVSRPFRYSLRRLGLFLGCTSMLYLAMSSFWVIPFLKVALEGGLLIPYIFTLETLQMLSRNSSILNVIMLRGNWYPTNIFDLPPPWSSIWSSSLLLTPIVAFSAITLGKKDKRKIALSLLAALSFLLATGTRAPLGEFYTWLCFQAPGISSSIGWLLRDPDKWSMTLPLSYSLLSAAMVSNFLNRKGSESKQFAGAILSLIIVSSACFAAFPLLTGDVRDVLKPEDVPLHYIQVYNWIEEQSQGSISKTLVWPNRPPWGTPNGMVREDFYHQYVQDLIENGKTVYLGKEIGFLGVQYLLLRGDSMESDKVDGLIRHLQMQKNLEEVRHDGPLWVYENLDYGRIADIPRECVLIGGGLEKFTALNSLSLFSPLNFGVIFIGQAQKGLVYDCPRIVVVTENLDDLMHLLTRNMHTIIPFDFTNRHTPSNVWSKAGTDDPLHGPWHPYLEQRGIENLDFDYGKGLVFTWAPLILEEPHSLKAEDLISKFDFVDKNLGNWTINTKNIQTLFFSEDAFEGAYSLKVELYNSTSGWKTINSPLIPAKYCDSYNWEFHIKGENSQSVHAKIFEYDENRKLITSHYITTIGTGNFSWEKTSFNFAPTSTETAYMQLQIWHGHETKQSLPNKVWIDNMKVYDLQRFVQPVTLEIPYTLPEKDEYVLLARVFQNQQGGAIKVQNNEETYTIETKDQLNKFTWKTLDTITLQKGQHKITLTNLEGFNAVNLFALAPKQEYLKAQEQLTQTLQDKRVIYILEGETDLYRQNAAPSNKYGGEASNGQILELGPDSNIWNQIGIVKPGNYAIAVRGRGTLNIKIDNHEYTTNTQNLNWTNIGSIHLETGTHKIEITPDLTYQAQWDFEGEDTDWTVKSPKTQTITQTNNPHGEGTSLKAELNASTGGWKTITSPLIRVTPNTKYSWSLQIAGENAYKAHIKIVEYDENNKPLIDQYMKGVGDGNFTWTPISFDYTPTQNTTYIALQIWHGHETTQPLPNRIWLDDVQVTGYQPSDLDVVWLYSTDKENETLEDLFKADETPAELLEFNKIDPTKYTVKINATKPFMLSFAESYDPLWIARVDGEKINSIPLYSVINGFWINKTGILNITIEYVLQRWFYMGSAISFTTLIACAIYLTHDWTKKILKRVKKWSRSNSS